MAVKTISLSVLLTDEELDALREIAELGVRALKDRHDKNPSRQVRAAMAKIKWARIQIDRKNYGIS